MTDLSCNCTSFHKRGIGVGVVIKDFTGCKSPLIISALGDIHGDAKIYKKVEEKLKEAREKDSRILLVGDLIDNKTVLSKSFSHGVDSPHTEIDCLSSLFKKFGAYIDGVVGGNHDMRTFKYSGEDAIRRLCLQYTIPYHPDAMVVIYRIGKTVNNHISKISGHRKDGGPVTYKVFMSHSMRGGRKEGGKLQKVVDYRNITNADVFLAGHSHDVTTHKGGYIDITYSGTLAFKEQLFVNCGSFQNYSGYMVANNYPPLPQGMATISLDHTTKYAQVLI